MNERAVGHHGDRSRGPSEGMAGGRNEIRHVRDTTFAEDASHGLT
ncbi:hypothetical protein AB0F03_19810 [Streptomyces sp. NPDC028722]